MNSGWGDDSKSGIGTVNSWNEAPLTPTSWGGSKPKNSLNPGWVDGDLEAASWGHAPKQVKVISFMSDSLTLLRDECGRWFIFLSPRTNALLWV